MCEINGFQFRCDISDICYLQDILMKGNKACQPCLTKVSNSCFRWLKFEEDVEDGGERWSKPYVATLSLHSLFELRSCIINSTVLLDMRANTIEEIAGNCLKAAIFV